MLSPEIKTRFNSKLLAVVSTVIVFVIDLLVPPGPAIGILYLIPMLLVIYQSKKTVIAFAAAASLLTFFDLIVNDESILHYSIYINRTLSVGGIWISCLILLKYRSLTDEKNRLKEKHLKAVEEMLFITSHKVRKPVSSLQGINNLLNGYEPTKENLVKICSFMKRSIDELDEFTRELTDFMYKENMNGKKVAGAETKAQVTKIKETDVSDETSRLHFAGIAPK